MFIAVISFCLAADPQACETRALLVPPEAEYSECLTAAGNASALWARQNRGYVVTNSFCAPQQPGQGR